MATRNRLAGESSPYLQQHADNPVDWYPWGDEALQLAREQDRPILLSIGYSACHWCHVMAHESFEDEQTAALMNEYFINIKVDREERPDLDKIYQLAHQLLTRRGGGWPLTVFLAPDSHMPMFAGTYFPPDDRHGLRSFGYILQAVHEAWQAKRADIEQQGKALREHLQQISQPAPRSAELTDALFGSLRDQLLAEHDSRHGGFTPPPKFPHPAFIERCLRQYRRYGDDFLSLMEAGLSSALRMAEGGLFDQIGGGFCRYSTDAQWMIPHFEKMLYDNGQLMALYAWAWQHRPLPEFQRAVSLTADWLMREMQHPAGGYFSAQDADSEGQEGKFYVWHKQAVAELLGAQRFGLFARAYGMDRPANFEGAWYPHGYESIAEICRRDGLNEQAFRDELERARRQLFDVRERRVRPGTDDKILTSWNALMIRGMFIAARVFKRPEYADSARRALDFIHQALWRDGRLLASWKNGRAHLNAYLDDYAYLLMACIESLQVEWDNAVYAWSLELAACLERYYANERQGGFYFTSHDHEALIVRSQSFADDAMPAGNAVAAQAMYYLGFLAGESRWLDLAGRTLEASSVALARFALGHASMMNVLDIALHSATVIVLRGPLSGMRAWQALVDESYLPDVLCFAIDSRIEPPPTLRDKLAPDQGVCAYICEGTRCLPPLSELNQLQEYLADLYPLKTDMR